jgi:superfamily II DNA or RNA helicase
MELQPGQRITAPFLRAPAVVKTFARRSGYALIDVVLEDEHHTYQSKRVFDDQLAQIELLNAGERTRIPEAEDFFLFIEANRLRLAHQFDPQLAVSVSQVDPLPHQIEAVYHYALRSPRIRFMIADDPGAGKTIMAGLILKELQLRQLVRRVLIVAPGHLKYQWQRELKERFGEAFRIVDRAMLNATWGANVWDEVDDAIASIDFLKQPELRESLRSARWDLIIVDEAHKMAAYAYETQTERKVDKTQRYRLGEVLSQQAEHLLFLTATPHKGDEENFRLFLDLLRPGFFAKPELLQESIVEGDNPIFIRRLKEDMYRFDGTRIFPPRHVQTFAFRLTDAERELYNGVTRYVQDYFDRAKENRSIAFALMILQRRLTSSTHAVCRSLERRKARLEELLTLPQQIREAPEDYLRAARLSDDEIDDLPEEDRLEIQARVEHLTIARNIDDVHAEIAELEGLIAQAELVRAQATESKLAKLHDAILATLGDRKLLIFTEFKDTLDYLAGDGQQGRPLGKLIEWGYDVVTIHGAMNMDARIEAEHTFRDRAQIMVATEAAGEGINLQFCSLMVNYDIPWNPNRLEQRMGRIHRYGQPLEVYIWNMIARDTREGQILERLFEKLDKMREALGSDRVFDIIDQVLPGTRLDTLIREAIFSQRRMEEIEQTIENVDVASMQQTMDEAFLTGLATRHIDYTGLRRETLEAEENRLVPEYVADYFLRAFHRLGGRVEQREGGAGARLLRVPDVPYELRRWAKDLAFKSAYGQLFREYRALTFNKAYARAHPEATFLAPGHPLLEAINETVLVAHATGPNTYALFGDPEGRRTGVLWFVEGAITDGAGRPAAKRVFCLHQTADGAIRPVNSAVLWDLEPQAVAADAPPPDSVAPLLPLLDDWQAVEDHVVTAVLQPYRAEIAARREREAAVKEKYGLRSLDYLMQESNQKILDYQLRQQLGEEMDLPLLQEQRNLEALQERHDTLEREIRLERNLTIDAPRILGAALVIPLPAAEPEGASYTYPEREGEPSLGREDAPAYGAKPQSAGPKPQSAGSKPQSAGSKPQSAGAAMHRDDEAEAVGMAVAMAYEREAGRHPEDVAADNLGFDVRAIAYNPDGTLAGARYIEVKARARTGAVRISANEWKKARHFGDDFWLYIVTGAKTDAPELHRIQNPAAHFRMDDDIQATGYIVQEHVWRGQLEEFHDERS